MKTDIECDKCHGGGTVPLPDHLLSTLAQVPKRGSVVAADLADKFYGITTNGISNRLQDLLKLGFLTRERSGKFWRYSRA